MEGRYLIYLVDDEEAFLHVASLALERAGYCTRTFTNPVDACATFRSAPIKPDLLILDFEMEEMNGLELLRHCRALVPNQKAICVSGGLRADAWRASNIQPDEFLPKPLARERLVQAVKRLLP
jgi:DNA-binding NtrC family response regulator